MIRTGLSCCVVLAALAFAPAGVRADAGASGASRDLARALALREAGDPAGALRLVEAALAAARGEAARWEARLARAEIAPTETEVGELLDTGAALFGPEAARLSGPLVAQAGLRAAQGDSAGATAPLLRATRLARRGYAAALGPDGTPRGDPQAPADLAAALAALAENLLDRGETDAAALLSAELAILAAEAPPALPPRWQDAAAIGALAQLRAGHPVEGLVRALPLLRLGEAPGTARARRLFDSLAAEVDAAAAANGDPGTVIEGWIAAAVAREAEIAAGDRALMAGMEPVMAALGAGDVVAADAAAQVALAAARPDDPLVTTAYLALLGASLRADRPDLAESWALRIAAMPPSYVASLDDDPVPLLGRLAAALRDKGALPGAISIGEAVAVLAPLRNEADAGVAVAALSQLALTYTDAGRQPQARDTFDQALALIATQQGRGRLDNDLATAAIETRVGRAVLRQDMGDLDGAADDLAAAVDLLATTGEGDNAAAWLHVGTARHDLARARGDQDAAEAVLRQTLARVEDLAGERSAAAAEAGFRLAQFLAAAGREAEAADPLRRATAAAVAALHPEDGLRQRITVLQAAVGAGAGGAPDLLAEVAAGGEAARLALAEAAAGAMAAGDATAAIAFLDAAIEGLDPQAPMRAYFEAGKGDVLFASGQTEAALAAFREATRALTRAERRDEPNARRHLPGHVAAALAMSEATDEMTSVNYFTEAFQVAQRVDDLSAGAALGRATARLLGSGPDADVLARRLEAAERDFATSREVYLATLAQGADTSGPRQALTASQEVFDKVRGEVRTAFPEYAGLADPRPLDLLATMRLLGPDEVLVLYASTGAGGAEGPTGQIFAITAEGFMAAPLAPRDEIAALARDLRCAAALTDRHCDGAGDGATRGAFSLSADGTAGAGPEFDFALARAAWEALLAPVEVALEGKSALIVVPDRTLSAMPFHLALAEPPRHDTTLRNAPWLLRRMAVTVVPSVASLAALRNRDAWPSRAELPFLGVGDPLIGAQANGPLPYDCGDPGAAIALAQAPAAPGGPILRDSGTADPAALAALPALPDTRCELQRNAAIFGGQSQVMIQAEATEAAIKAMSVRGDLARFRILSFATHGLIAGEVGAANAGLVLTPPASPDAEDDGLLTVSEIAVLNLDADFVILSACNTASGSSDRSEGLAGLASAFFLAGTRGLLVSHWPVYSDAATDLTTGMVAALSAPDRPGRAEALRRAAMAILDDPAASPRQMHPAYWAPFLVVGDGGAVQG